MKKQVAKCLASLIYFCSAHSALARLGDGPLVDEMLRCADVVCAGRVTGYDFVATGPTSVWVIAEFTMDHVVKGNAVTNKIGLMGYRLVSVRRSSFREFEGRTAVAIFV